MTEYWPSFKPDEHEKYCKAFCRDGFVVIDGVLTPEECERSQAEVFEYLEKENNVSRCDPTTWNNEAWPKDICRNGGFMGKFPYWKRMNKLDGTFVNKQPQAWRNRENQTVYDGFCNVMKEKKLWVSIDRYGIMRPTCMMDNEERGVVEKPEWQTKRDWLHWDLSPFHYGTSAAGFAPKTKLDKNSIKSGFGGVRVQGLITLTDCKEEAGGFHCVPGFHGERFAEWGKTNREYGEQPDILTRNFIEVPENDEMRKEITRIPMRAGSLLIWNSQLPHGNFPNSGTTFRMVQYIKMIPATDKEFTPAMVATNFSRQEWFPESYTPSPLAEKLYGLTPWE